MHNISLNAVPYSTNTNSTTLLDDAYMKLNHDWSLLKQYTEFRLDRKIEITILTGMTRRYWNEGGWDA